MERFFAGIESARDLAIFRIMYLIPFNGV